MAKLTVEVVTGERLIYEDTDVDMVIAEGTEGVLGILPRHAPLVTTLRPGELRIQKGGQEESLVVYGGFLEVFKGRLIVLADSAERTDEIDAAAAEEARRQAAETRSNASSTEDIAAAETALAQADVRVRLGGRGRRNLGGNG